MASALQSPRLHVNETTQDAQVTPKLHITWSGYEKLTLILAKNITESGWKFDQIVCIARGGMFVGDALSRLFDKPLAIISASSYREEEGTQQNKLMISERIAMTTNTLGKRILLVDDLVDSGVTMKEVKESIKMTYPNVEEVKTAVLWRKTGTSFEVDYFAEEKDKSTWIVQPFEIYESMKND